MYSRLSATIGTGNIVGVATGQFGVLAGGPGALFWMWLAAFFGMATKYAEGFLAVKYIERLMRKDMFLGGPFYYIENGMGLKWKMAGKKFLHSLEPVSGLFGIGTFSAGKRNCIGSAVFL